MSQRDPGGPVQTCIARTEANLRMLLDIPQNYKVLFFQVCGRRVRILRCLQAAAWDHSNKIVLFAGRSPRTICSCSDESLW